MNERGGGGGEEYSVERQANINHRPAPITVHLPFMHTRLDKRRKPTRELSHSLGWHCVLFWVSLSFFIHLHDDTFCCAGPLSILSAHLRQTHTHTQFLRFGAMIKRMGSPKWQTNLKVFPRIFLMILSMNTLAQQ